MVLSQVEARHFVKSRINSIEIRVRKTASRDRQIPTSKTGAVSEAKFCVRPPTARHGADMPALSFRHRQ